MTKKFFNKKNKNAILSVCLAAALIITSAFCFLYTEDSLENKFTAGNLLVELHEDDWFSEDTGNEIIINDAKIINSPLSDVYNAISTMGNFDTLVMYDSNDNAVDDINDAVKFTAVSDTENIIYYADNDVTVESNGINDFAEGIIPGQEIHTRPYLENTGTASCYAFIVLKTPTLSIAESYIDSEGHISNTDTVYSIQVKGYAVQRGYGNIKDSDPKYTDNWSALINDVWGALSVSILPSPRTQMSRVNFVAPLDVGEDWEYIEMYQGSDNCNYYIYGYGQFLNGYSSTSPAINNFTLTGYLTKSFTLTNAPTNNIIVHSYSQGSSSYSTFSSSYLTQFNALSSSTSPYVLSSVTEMNYFIDDNGMPQFEILLKGDGDKINKICTNYVPTYSTTDRGDYPNSTSVYTYAFNIADRNIENRTSNQALLKYGPPCTGTTSYSMSSHKYGVSYVTSNVVGIPVCLITSYTGASISNLEKAVNILPLSIIKIQQEDGSYVSYELNNSITSATQVTLKSNNGVFYNGTYAEWIEACVNTGMLIGDYSWLV